MSVGVTLLQTEWLDWTCLPPAGQFSAFHHMRGKSLDGVLNHRAS